MPQVLHDIEKKIIKELKQKPELKPEELESLTGLNSDQVRRGIEWLKLKNLATVKESQQVFVKLGKNGLIANEKGLPETQLIKLIKEKPRSLNELQKELQLIFGPAMGVAKKNGWIETTNNMVSLKNTSIEIPEEQIIQQIGTKAGWS